MSCKIFFNIQRIFISEIVLRCLKIPTMSFYAVAKGRTPGIFNSWADCESQVKGFSGARYKKFKTVTEAHAYISTYGGNNSERKTLPHSSDDVSLLSRFSTSTVPNTHKRPINTLNQNNSDNGPSKPKKKTTKPRRASSDSNTSDDLNTIIVKQLDDIEKRLSDFQKGVDKITKTSAKSDRKAILIEPQNHGRVNGSSFEIGNDGYVQVYTDGACSANGKKGAKAGLGVYWGEGHPLNISEPVTGRATNNCGEIQAATRAIQQAIDNGVDKITINTDSKFLINSVTKWIPGWKRKGWKLKSGEPVKNETDFKNLDKIQEKVLIKWNYVEAHRGVHGNERADQLAKAGAAMYSN